MSDALAPLGMVGILLLCCGGHVILGLGGLGALLGIIQTKIWWIVASIVFVLVVFLLRFILLPGKNHKCCDGSDCFPKADKLKQDHRAGAKTETR